MLFDCAEEVLYDVVGDERPFPFATADAASAMLSCAWAHWAEMMVWHNDRYEIVSTSYWGTQKGESRLGAIEYRSYLRGKKKWKPKGGLFRKSSPDEVEQLRFEGILEQQRLLEQALERWLDEAAPAAIKVLDGFIADVRARAGAAAGCRIRLSHGRTVHWDDGFFSETYDQLVFTARDLDAGETRDVAGMLARDYRISVPDLDALQMVTGNNDWSIVAQNDIEYVACSLAVVIVGYYENLGCEARVVGNTITDIVIPG